MHQPMSGTSIPMNRGRPQDPTEPVSLREKSLLIPSLLSDDIPMAVSDYLPEESGKYKWNNAWEAYLKREYAPDRRHPDPWTAIKPKLYIINSPLIIPLIQDQWDLILTNQKLLFDLLVSPWTSYNHRSCNLSRGFKEGWVVADPAKREEVIVDALVHLCENLDSEGGRRHCPEASIAFLQRAGGRMVLQLLVEIFKSVDHPQLPAEPIFFKNPVIDRMWSFDSYAHRTDVNMSSITRFKDLVLRDRSNTLCTVLITIVGKFLDIPNNILEPRSEATKQLLQYDKKYHFLPKSERAECSRMFQRSHRICASCLAKEEPQAKGQFGKCPSCDAVGRKANYCSEQCQRDHWETHKVTCGKPTAS